MPSPRNQLYSLPCNNGNFTEKNCYMISLKKKHAICLLLMIAMAFGSVRAQTREDSLRALLAHKNLSLESRIPATVRLAQAVFFNKDWHQGIQLYRQAIAQAVPLKDGQYRAHAYGAIAGSYYIMGDSIAAYHSLDSAIWYARRTTDKTMKGYVLYMKGWLEIRSHKEIAAIHSLQQALELLESTHVDAIRYRLSVYNELAGVYFTWYDLVNIEKYTRLALDLARKTDTPDDLIDANQGRGNYFIHLYQKDINQKPALDSALYYMRVAFAIGQANRDRLVIPGNIPFVALNISNVFLAFFPDTPAIKDSIDYYNGIALEEAKITKQVAVEAGVYNTLGSIAFNKNDFKKAISYFNAAIGTSMKDILYNKFDLSQSFLMLAEVYEKTGDTTQSLHHYKRYMTIYKELFDEKKMNNARELEARYEVARKEKDLLEVRLVAEQRNRQLVQARILASQKDRDLLTARYAAILKDKDLLAARHETDLKQQALVTANYKTVQREQELKVMSERERYNRKMNKIYTALTIALFLAGLFLYYAYQQRSQSLEQTRKLHVLELDKLKQDHRISMLSATLEGQEQERTRLARDLHDGLGGLLSAVKIDLSGLTALVTAPNQSIIVGKTLNHLDTAVDELRRIAKSMMPEVLLVYGLGEATREYCDGMKKSGIPVTCQVYHYKNDMDVNRQVALYRIMQELVNNAIKHASATQILVQLQQSGNTIYLTVEDDGHGFNKVQMNQLKGAGLANMQSRVEMLKGRLEVQSTPGTGASFTVECLIKAEKVLAA